jgi:histidine triad (HIT) family protein
MTKCIFCRIAAGEIPAEVVLQDDAFVAFRDIAPKAPVHLVVIPRRHVASLAQVAELTEDERARMPVFLAETADQAGLTGTGYRVAANHGANSRQSVFHLHWHILGGALLSDSM